MESVEGRAFTTGRMIMPQDFGNIVNYKIHTFFDAFEVAYGAMSYVRITNVVGQNHCSILMALSSNVQFQYGHETGSFLNAFQRFICRRGTPDIIRSDNGTNFVGAEKGLKAAINNWNKPE